MNTQLIDRIYESALVPELWPDVLDELAQLVEARGAQLFAVREKVMNWTTSAALTDIFKSYVNDGWFARCDRRVCLFSQNKPSFLVEHDFWTNEQLDGNEIYRDFFRPHGLGWSASTGLAMPTRDNIVFTVERDFKRGPIEPDKINALNELRPHLARAALIAARLSLKSVQGASNTLTALGLPALVLDEDGVVVEANVLMQDLSEHIHWRAQGRIVLNDKTANALLWAALPALDNLTEPSARSFVMRAQADRAALVTHLVPIKRSANDLFGRSYALLVATPVTAGRAPPVELLRSLFDLTPSEARVARGLAAGESLDDIAENGGVSRNTVRAQLQRVMDKIGCTRQAEVTALLSSVTPPAPPL
jgi:DNA-binding CsgD family transcriptional regulator